MKPFQRKRIICGTDFSPPSFQAANVAAALAARLNETLVLVHVVDREALPTLNRSLLDELSHTAQVELEQLSSRLREHGATVKTEIAEGNPAELLSSFGLRPGTRLIVVSSLGRKAPGRFLLGSTAERTAEHAPAPTLIVRGEGLLPWLEGSRPLRVFAGVDFTTSATAALQWVKELGRVGPCAVTVGYVDWPPQEIQRLGGTRGLSPWKNPPEIQQILERELREKAEHHLGKALQEVRVEASWGRPDAQLIEMATESQADLLVVGTHQRHGAQRLWHASASRAILHHAPMSVACVPLHVKEELPPITIPPRQRVLVATDFSALGNSAVAHAYAGLGPGAMVRILHVLSPSASRERRSRNERLVETRQALQALAPQESRNRGIETEVEVIEHREPATGICQSAERFGADLICLASHGRSGMARALLGSVAQAVLSRTHRPLLIIRPLE